MSNRFPLLASLAADVAHEDFDETPYPLDDIINYATSLTPSQNLRLAAECRAIAELRGANLSAALDDAQWVWDMDDDAQTTSMFGHFADLFEGIAEELSAA